MQYKLEGGIDFYAELAKESTIEDDSDTEVCNINGEPLGEYHITLLCGHKFNYEPLYNEIKTQKLSVKVTRSIHKKLSVKQLKCPLCRNIQSQLLPWIPHFTHCPKIYGVNSPSVYSMYINKCDYIFKNGKKKGLTCGKPCNDKQCKLHTKDIVVPLVNEIITGCPAIIKSGINKGKLCGCPIKQNGFCNRHNK